VTGRISATKLHCQSASALEFSFFSTTPSENGTQWSHFGKTLRKYIILQKHGKSITSIIALLNIII
jgi:hypothetical protein